MARKVDITDKLTFDGNPFLVIKGKELEVNADAPTMLKVMGNHHMVNILEEWQRVRYCINS